MERLDKIIAGHTGLTRKEVHTAIAKGMAAVDGIVAKKADLKIDPEIQNITFQGQDICYKKFRYFLLNKPSNLLTATSDSRRETVIDLFSAEPRYKNLFPVGRLDKDTTGLLLVTDDGDYAHRVISPKSRVEKEYIAHTDLPVPDDAAEKFLNGITLADGTQCLPAKLYKIEDNCAGIVVFEGKYHQIKRMLGVVGLGVEKLHRCRIANLLLPDKLAAGEYVELTREEAYSVFEADAKNE